MPLCESHYIYDEAVTLTRTRVEDVSAATALGRRIRGADPFPVVYDLLRVSAAVFTRAVELFEQYDDQALSFTDATTIALLRRHNIDAVLSFDDDFDGLVDRIAPGDL